MENFIKSESAARRVLIVDDEFINREILGNILNNNYSIEYAENGKVAVEMTEKNDYSLILLDLLMPVMDGFETLKYLKSHDTTRDIPVIVMTSEKEAEVKSIELGAVDFITKPYDMPEVIYARCERIIEFSEDKSIIRSAEKDTLTELYNREFFYEYIRRMDISDDKKMDASVLNIEHFHMINEFYGRRVGDNVLKSLGEAIIETLKDVDGIGCRSEADTYFVYCTHREDYERIISDIEEKIAKVEGIPNMRIRIGIYPDPENLGNVETWFDRAKVACDGIRGDYNRQIAFYDNDLYEKSLYNERLIKDIDKAIEEEQFIVYFQPKYGIQGDKPHLRSAEALIRWIHPELGFISPGDFIPLFERNGLIQKIDKYVWRKAAEQIRDWKDRFGMTVPVSVNVSRIDIYDPKLEETLADILDSNRLTPQEYMLEITESAYSEDADRLINVVENLRKRGFRVEMDDFGSGYSSLNMLTALPIDVLKLDMKFIRNMEKDEKNLKLVELIMDIAKFLKVPVVAEGVETESQLGTLKDMGCDVIQGYYFSKPVPANEFDEFIINEKSA